MEWSSGTFAPDIRPDRSRPYCGSLLLTLTFDLSIISTSSLIGFFAELFDISTARRLFNFESTSCSGSFSNMVSESDAELAYPTWFLFSTSEFEPDRPDEFAFLFPMLALEAGGPDGPTFLFPLTEIEADEADVPIFLFPMTEIEADEPDVPILLLARLECEPATFRFNMLCLDASRSFVTAWASTLFLLPVLLKLLNAWKANGTEARGIRTLSNGFCFFEAGDDMSISLISNICFVTIDRARARCLCL